MKFIKAQVVDIPFIVKNKMISSKESGAIEFMCKNAEKCIMDKYIQLYKEEKLFHILLTDDNNKFLAMSGAVLQDDIPFCFFDPPYSGYIVDVYCVPDERKKGYASAAIKEVIDNLKEIKCSVIRLHAAESAQPMYEKLGFAASGDMHMIIKN